MPGRRPTVSTIAPGAPFVDVLAAGVLARHGGDPLALARVTVLLPTRRACLALRDAFLRRGGGGAMLLPRLTPLGDIDEADPLADAGVAEDAEDDIPPAISELRRRLLLTRMILKWGNGGGAFARADQAARLAGELARLLDRVQTHRLSFDALAGLVPDDYAGHWQDILEFLAILTAHWPGVLAERGLIDPAERRNLMLEALARRWRAAPPSDPVIAAGSTGSIPATADLLALVSGLPRGEVVLPGLDREADDATWEAIDDCHPQNALKRLLERIGTDRGQVADWPHPDAIATTHPGRARLLSLALCPAATWGVEPPPGDAALAGLERIDCPGAREEAGVIALKMRAALDEPGHTAALVTRDRALARRVAAELRRWGVEIDDSGGRPLADTPPGGFLRLTAALVAGGAAPLALLAALKHPLAAGGLKPGTFRARVRRLECAVLRGPRPGEGFGALARALGAAGAPAGLRRWLERIAAAARPFGEAMARESTRLEALARAHLGFAEWLAGTDAESGPERLWRGEAGEATAGFFAELLAAAGEMPPLAGAAYPALLDSLLEGRVVRPRWGRHPRLNIWGPLEARLQHADWMILGGLNEGSWPPQPAVDPWLSRPMRAEFGLPPPESAVGLSAHDFVQCASARNATLTRAAKVEGTPAVPSRWLTRLENRLIGWGLEGRIESGPQWLGWLDMLDRPDEVRPVGPPAPRPPVAARPRRLPVTAIETWRRDPYAIYARRILGLKPLDPIDADPGAAERGRFIHEALDKFVKEFPGALPDDAYERLLEFGQEAYAGALDRPGVWAFWWPRFERIARWFVDAERARRPGLEAIAGEVEGSLAFDAPGGAFTLTAKADRIERRAGGGLVVIDYKTGVVPSDPEVERGMASQLPLEAAIARAGGFARLPAGAVEALAYWRLSGGEPAGMEQLLKGDAEALADAARDGLERLIAAFDDEATPYHALPSPELAPRFNDFEHLARVKEWSDTDEGSEAA